MSNFLKRSSYKNLVCSNCGFSWDYPIVIKESLNALQNLFYFEMHLCPHCKSIGNPITEVGELELNLQKDKAYLDIIKQYKNPAFALTSRSESYKYLLYAYISLVKNNIYESARGYLMAGKVERYQREQFMDSMIYNEKRDTSVIANSKYNEQIYYNKCKDVLKTYISTNKIPTACLLLAYVYKLVGELDNYNHIIEGVLKLPLTKEDIVIIKLIREYKVV